MMQTSILAQERSKRYLIVINILLFLTAADFFKSASKIIMGTMAFFFVVFMVKQKRRIPWEPQMIMVLLFSVCSCVSAAVFFSLHEMIQTLFWFLSFCVGRWACKEAKNKKEYVVTLSFAITTGYGINVLINYLYNLICNKRIAERVVFSIWSEEQIAVTYWGPIAIMFASGVFFFMVESDSRWKKALFLLLCMGAMGFGLASATRTMLFSVFVVPGICLLLKLSHCRFDRRLLHKGVLFLLVLLVLMGFLFAIFYKDITSSAFFSRFLTENIFDSGRGQIAVFYILNLIRYPFGGRHVNELYAQTAHNVFLDVYDSYGLFSFLLIVALIFLVLKDVAWKCLKRDETQKGNKEGNIAYLYCGIASAFMIMCFVEPCTHSNISAIWVMLFLFGAITEEISVERKDEIS